MVKKISISELVTPVDEHIRLCEKGQTGDDDTGVNENPKVNLTIDTSEKSLKFEFLNSKGAS